MQERNRLAYIATRIMDTPFWAIYNMLQLILYKDLKISALQLTVMIALKPIVSLLSFYWSALVNRRRERLVTNVILTRILGYLPFFFFPFVDNPWFFIFSFGLYMMLAVGMVPTWMEILKLTIPSRIREKTFSYAQAFGYMGGGILPFAFGWLLDGHHQAWRWLFPAAATFALCSLFFQWRMILPQVAEVEHAEEKPLPLLAYVGRKLLQPWQAAWRMLHERGDFRQFQVGSMILGSGLMIIQPALFFFFVDTLELSYTELALALAFCKGLGFATGSPIWPRLMHRINIYKLSSIVALLACLFPLSLYCATYHIIWLYFGYICYGFMQSGHELIWNLSGPHFAQQQESSLFTSINVLAGGLRGCCIPALGSLLLLSVGAPFVIGVGGILCLTAAARWSSYSRRSFSMVKG